jgi:PHD/YefM family antitoxin component YafN of YafNO toxin-antitoxin module
MTTTLSAMEVRHRFGEILNRVNLVHEHFIIERKGQQLAVLVPMSAWREIKLKAAKEIEKHFESSASNLSDEEATKIAQEEIELMHKERRKRKK